MLDKYQDYWLNLNKQVEELSSNGIEYPDKNTVINIIQTIGFYNINVYTFTYDMSTHKVFKYFGDKVDIMYIHMLYNFDRELRSIVIDIATNIEMRFKAYIGSYLGLKYGAKGHLIKENYYDKDNDYPKFASIVKNKDNAPTVYYLSSSDRDFYYNASEFPVWLVCQQLTLGELSKMYGNLQYTIQEKIIQENYTNKDVIKNWKSVKGWLKGITDMRNICAHNNKLFDWRSTFKNPFALPNINKYNRFRGNTNSLFTALIICRLLMNDKYNVNNYDWNVFINKLDNCISRYSFDNNFKPLGYMGFPSDWKEILLKY